MKIRLFVSLAILALFVVFPSFSWAGFYEGCRSCDRIFCDPFCGKASQWFIRGHAEAGLFRNEYGRRNEYGQRLHGPNMNSGNTNLLKNVHSTDLELNQLYVSVGRKLDTSKGFDIGGQVDFAYGTDARFYQTAGLEYDSGHGRWASGDYYTALAQAYVEAGYKNLSVKVGKFFIPCGINSVVSPDRFFYSLSDSFEFNPVSGSGAMVSWTPSKKWSIYAGWVQPTRFFDSSHDNAFIGGFRYQVTAKTTLEFSFLQRRRTDRVDMNSFLQTFRIQHQFNTRWDYTFEWTLHNITIKNAGVRSHPTGYGINNELHYRFNDRFKLGVRAEWTYTSLLLGGFADDKYSFSLGANWTPVAGLVIRPELRYDKFKNQQYFKNLTEKRQISGGFSMVVKF